ncbi:unnamed protein product [Urochloa decumbens]|uniref:Uncharacterized protein n=1 Tax=Urochloa decumbens TaxID=240449 RepID=A0ABC9BJM7_9POAL
MAAAAAVHPAPTSPLPAGNVVARRARSRLAAAGSNAVTCLFIADMWLLFWGLGPWNVGRLACGVGCPMTEAAAKVFVAAGVAFVFVAPFSLILMARRRTAGAAIDIDIEAVEAAPASKSTAAALREALRDPVVIAVFASVVFAFVVLAGLLVKGDSPIKGSRRERVGSAIYDVGALGMDTVNCLIVCPILTMRTWRTMRFQNMTHNSHAFKI